VPLITSESEALSESVQCDAGR